MSALRLPPYAGDLMRLRRAGRAPALSPFGHVVIVTDWTVEGDFYRLVVTPEHAPEELEFAGIAGLAVSIAHRAADLHLVRPGGRDWLDLLILAVLECNPARLTLLNIDAPRPRTYLRREAHG